MHHSLLTRSHLLRSGSIVSALLALLFLGLPFLLPRALPTDRAAKDLEALRSQARSIKAEFAALEGAIGSRLDSLAVPSFPYDRDRIFQLFKGMEIDQEFEGLAYFNEDGELSVWLGNALDFRPTRPGRTFLLRHKSSVSVYLLSSRRIRQSEQLVFYRLLAFRPRLTAPYLGEYNFLGRKLRKNGHVDFLDFREDVSGFEAVFSRHQDEYLGEPRSAGASQQVFFPLRNSEREIVATVSLGSPSQGLSHSRLRESMLVLSGLALVISLIFFLVELAKSAVFGPKKRTTSFFLLLLVLAGLRFLFVPLSRLERIQSLPMFSPSAAAFFSFGDLTRSPADIFLSSLFLFLAVFFLAVRLWNLRSGKRPPRPFTGWIISLALAAAASVLLGAHEGTLSRLVFNANIHLLGYSADLSFLLLHLSIALFFLGLFSLCLLAYRLIRSLIPGFGHGLLLLLISQAALFAGFGRAKNPFLLAIETAVLVLAFVLAAQPRVFRRQGALFVFLFLAAGLNTWQLRLQSTARLQSQVQDFLRQTVVSQEDWADFLIRQSLPEIEKRKASILSFLQDPHDAAFARSLWESTLAAKFNWYSTLELLDPEGLILSRFSLNIPQLYEPELELPRTSSWKVSRLIVPSLGKEREFILAYKDWSVDDKSLGRMTFSLTVDPEILPFLYSANPYFEMLKVSSLPSFHGQRLAFAIFDSEGKFVFNPAKISASIPPDLLPRISGSPQGIWSSLRDKDRQFRTYHFRYKNRIYSFLIPQKSITGMTVELLKLLILYLTAALCAVFLFRAAAGKKRITPPLWSFSSRVYAAFLTITVLSLLLFTLFSHRFFTRMFHQQFVEKAEIHADFARNVMQDFVFLQQEERATLIAPTDDLVLWISSAIANDVNLYQDGRLLSSSRREFYDWGLLPELVDGEAYFRLRYENEPFFIQRQKIGEYSYQTLTIPYTIGQSRFLISLPFPFEAQEIAGATEEFVESLVFISAFFLIIVFVFARSIGRTIISPVKKLLAGTREVGLGNLEIAVSHSSHDEMKTLVDGFNAMIKELKRHQQEIADLSKKVAWAEIAQRVAHEIKNPLTPIQLSAEHILRVYEDKSEDFEKALRESASYIVSEVENLRRIAQEFLELARASDLKKEVFDLKEAMEEVTAPYKNVLTGRIRFREVFGGDAFPVAADRSKIKIAFRNIFINAIEAIRGRGEIEIILTADKDAHVLVIKDTGIGMTRDVLEKIFDPYFSTKDEGTGLGLPIAKKIIEDHGGSIRVESEVRKGTTITMILPAA